MAFFDDTFCHIVSFLMEEIPINDGHYLVKEDYLIDHDKLAFIGWFQKRIDPMIQGFWDFVKTVKTPKISKSQQKDLN